MAEKIIRVLDFSEYPGPRYKSQGKSSGELFYEKILKDEFSKIVERRKKGEDVLLVLDLDNTAGYASSFLDECIGNIVYDHGAEIVNSHLKLITTDEPDWNEVIFKETIPEWELKRTKGVPRKQV